METKKQHSYIHGNAQRMGEKNSSSIIIKEKINFSGGKTK